MRLRTYLTRGVDMCFNLETVKQHLRVDHAHDDLLLTNYMAAAKNYADTFLGKPLTEYDPLPGTVLAGLLLHVTLLYEDREGSFSEKNLRAVKLLYWPYREMSL
jgi:uncharacterized phage protein (predicted DNA packaging)